MAHPVLNAINILTTSLLERLMTKVVKVDTELQFGRRYLALNDVTLTLPSVASRTKSSTIHLNRANGVTVMIEVNQADATTQIRDDAVSGDAYVFDTDRAIVIHFDHESGKWIV